MQAKWELIGKATGFVAEEMGIALKRSAVSPNIRERMDHSCAVLDRDGLIIAQAEHIPVHLGSFRTGARNIMKWMHENNVSLNDGDMLMVNDPYISGTHLNDVTIIAPVYYSGDLFAYVINKAHNVDVGGPVPGSLNPNARRLHDEGFIIPPVFIARGGEVNSEIFSIMMENFKDPGTAKGDLNAQLAANRMGIQRVTALCDRFSPDIVEDAWKKSVEHSRILSEKEISTWNGGTYEAEDFLEIDEEAVPLRVKVSISRNGVAADFTGTHEQVRAPLNAVPGVTYSATAFAVRSIMRADVPTNEGFYRTIEIEAPDGCLVNPVKPYPVSGGNVETTQRIADLVLLALSRAMPSRVPAASSGTMMNVMMGGERPDGRYWAYYETICGGNGARPNGDGVSAVHSNMTNTLNTPVEVAEMEYPLVFTANMIRSNSGGDGKFRGGDGIIRSFRVLEPSTLSMIGERFIRPPWGLAGGEPGRRSSVTVVKGGRRMAMPGKFTIDLDNDDEVIIETPGGGGYGRK